MDRGREGRRGSVGGGSVSAPRRPRTIGFKDASVGEDAEDVADDVPNPRLRERTKKDNSGSISVQGVPTSGGGSVSRCKRKRQGSQDMQDQGRSSAVDDVDETTEDTDMGVSDDDDDPPPPPISRRAAKFRPQGKFSEDVPNVDLPAVPRKARTAILKRPQEATSPSVVDGSSHQGSAAIPRTSTPSSAPSSSSVVSLKPGRRTKPISSKPRASKVAKVADQSAISEQEVEVAEALFDLARLFAKQPSSIQQDVSFRGANAGEVQEDPSVEPGVKVESEAFVHWTEVSSKPFQTSTPSIPASSTVSSVVASQTAVPSSPPVLTGCSSPITTATTGPVAVAAESTGTIPPLKTSLPPVAVAPPAEAPKRKRPRLRSKFDELGLAPQGAKREARADDVGNPGLPYVSSRPESEQKLNRMFHSKDEISVEVEMGASAALLATAASIPPVPYIPTAVYTEVPRPQMPAQRSNMLEELEMCSTSEKVATTEVFTSSISKEETQMLSSTRMPVLTTVGVSGPSAVNSEVEPALYNTFGISTETNVDVDGRCPRGSNTVIDEDRPKNILIDLMVLPAAKSSLPVTSSRAAHGSDSTADYKLNNESIQGKVEFRALREQEQKPNTHFDRECAKAREPEKKRNSIVETDQERQKEHSQGAQLYPSSDTDQGHGEEEAQSRMGPSLEKSADTSKSDSKALNMEGAAVVQATSAPSFGASGIQATGAVTTTGASCVAALPVSMGVAGWSSLGLQPMGYFSSGGGAVANVSWHGGASPSGGSVTVDEQIATGLELQHPYIIQPRNLQSWKRCASHVYIAHFIDAQQQMNRHPFIQAAYQNSANLHGQKSFTQKNPFVPGDALFGVGSKPLLNGTVGTNGACLGTAGGSRSIVPGSERNFSSTPVLTSTQAKESMYMEALARKQGVQLPRNSSSQARPGFGVSATHASTVGPVAVSTLNEAGHVGDSTTGSGSMVYGISSGCSTGSNPTSGAGASNCGVVSHAAAQAQYLQAVMQQGGFPFPFQNPAHFGHGFSGSGHQQAAAQFFSSPFYSTHLVPSSAQPQQMPQQASNASNLSVGLLPNQVQQQQQQQQQTMPMSPSHSQQLQKLQRSVDRDENNAVESTGASENKPLTQKSAYGQGTPSPSVPSSSLPPTLRLGGIASVHSPPSQDIIAVIGGKQAKQQKQSQTFSQHHQNQATRQLAPGQHITCVAALGGKGMDQQSPRLLSGKSSTAGPSPGSGPGPGPGPLGLTPVAPMMAPQGHAVLQSVSDSSMAHGQSQHQEPQHQCSAVSHPTQQPLHPCQQLQRAMQMGTSTGGVDEDRTVIDGNSLPGKCGREVADERKASAKRGVGSRLQVDSTTVAIQGPPGGVTLGSRAANSLSPALNIMTPTSAVLVSRPAGHLSGADLQQAGSGLPASLSGKQATARNKVPSGAATANAVTAPSQMVPFPDRPLAASSLPNKVSGPPLSLKGSNSGQGIHVPRQNPSPQHPQLKYSSKGSISSLSAPSGTAPQAVLAAAIAKSQQGAQQQHSRPQIQGSTNAATMPNLPSGNVGSLTVSVGISLPALSPPSKSATTGTTKSTLCNKGSFSLAQKSGVFSKRCTSSGGSNVVSSLGPAPLVQSSSTKLPLQVQQNSSPHHVQPPQQPPASLPQPLPHLLQPVTQQHVQKFQHQQALGNPQQPNQVPTQHNLMPQQQSHQLQRQAFLHTVGFQQNLHVHGSQTSSHPQQQAQQRSSVQLQPQVSTPPPQPQHQPQQHPTPQLHHQQQGMQQQQHPNVHSSSGHFCGTVLNGSFCLDPPVLTLGTGNNGSSSASWAPGSDSGTPQSSAARSNSTVPKGTGSSGISPQSSNSQKVSGPSFMHPQFGSGSSAVQNPGSPRSNPGLQYLSPANGTGGSGISVDEKSTSGAL